MKQQVLPKETVIEKLKSGSMGIAALCVIAALFNIAAAVSQFIIMTENKYDTELRYALCRTGISYLILTVIMALAAVMFIRIAKDGMPFTAQNTRTVRIIGILFLVNAVIPSVTSFEIIRGGAGPLALVNPPALVEGLLFLFIAHIMHYGSMLQQESDETL